MKIPNFVDSPSQTTQGAVPVAARWGFDGYGWTHYLDNGSGSDWLKRATQHDDVELLYAQAALGAQLAAAALEGERKGMQMAAEIAGQKSAVLPHYPDVTRGYAQGRSAAREAILAKMEKFK